MSGKQSVFFHVAGIRLANIYSDPICFCIYIDNELGPGI